MYRYRSGLLDAVLENTLNIKGVEPLVKVKADPLVLAPRWYLA